MAQRKKASETIVKKPKSTAGAKLRKKPEYKSFRLHKRIKHHGPPLPSGWQLAKKSLALMRANKKPMLVLFAVHAVLTILLVRGFASVLDIEILRETFREALGDEQVVNIATGFAAFGQLINSVSSQGAGEVGQLYQNVILVFVSLAIIWLYRQQQAGNDVTMKMAFYRGMYPLVPFLLVFLVLGAQLLPALAGNFVLATVVQNSLAATSLEQFLWFLLDISTILLSLYMICGSAIALYIVTLPEMTPMLALRKARELVRYRRFAIITRVVVLIAFIILGIVAVILPLIFLWPLLAEWMFFSLTILVVPFIHGYLFSLYRELL